jgi:PQQ-like domain
VTGTTGSSRPAPEPSNATITYPGGLRARWRWGGSGQSAAVFALTEAGGTLHDLGPRVSDQPDALCRAELRLDGPRGGWTARFASTIYDEPRALYRDSDAQLVVAYGFHTYGLDAATGEMRWEHRSASPIVALLGSSRLPHVLVQSEIETFALEADGTVGWRVAHSDVVTAAELVGGRLVLTGFDGQLNALDTSTGREVT